MKAVEEPVLKSHQPSGMVPPTKKPKAELESISVPDPIQSIGKIKQLGSASPYQYPIPETQ
jgi:hypothetical protein